MEWLKRPLRIADFSLVNLQEVEGGEFQIQRSLDKKAGMGFNVEHFFPHKRGVAVAHGAIEPDWEILSQYLEAAHRRGIRLFLYYNVHWYSLEMAEKHPDWFQYDFQGKLIDNVYGKGVMSCVNTGWRGYTYEYIRRFARFGVDGIFLDGPCFHPEGCYCKSCRERFRRRYGKELPRKGDLANPDHRLLVEFQEDSMAEYMKEAYRACKEENPDVAIYLNGEPLRPSWVSGRNNRKLELYQDLVGAEGGFIYGKLIETPIFKPGMTAKGLEAQAPEKPRVIFVAAKHCPWNKNPLTGPELKLLCAQTLANGANYWIGYTFPDPGLEESIKEINGWVAGNEEYFCGTKNAAEVGLFWSYETANTYGGEVPQSDFTGKTIRVKRDYMKSFQGAYEILQRSHIPFKVVDKLKSIGNLKLLLLPNCACLGPDEVDFLEDYVREGGKLMVSFETSLYFEGGRREDFALGDLLGVHFCGIEEYGAFENYFQMGEEFFPAYTYVMKVEPKSAEVLGYVSENSRGCYQPIIMSKFPALCRNALGKGKVYYFCGNFFQTYLDYKFTKYLSLFQRILDSEVERKIILENAPESIEVTLRRKEDALLIHLINFSSGLKRPMEDVIPVGSIVLKLPGIRPTSVTCLLGEVPPRWEMRGELLEITLPRLHEYEVIVVKEVGPCPKIYAQ
ncbi:MAG TPA: hypothetical protein EYP53_02795 [Candidatus Latescibacteria bacterium]|nr:hypothetical protein [Candidatus Latescibacterota bacterium]